MPLRFLFGRRKIYFGICAIACAVAFAATLGVAGCSRAAHPYARKWVSKYLEKNFIVLNLKFADGHYSGVMAMPKSLQLGPNGSFTDIASAVGEEQIATAEIVEGRLKFTAKDADGENQFSVTFVDHDHATLEFVGAPMAPFRLARASNSGNVSVATDWPTGEPATVSPEIAALQVKLKQTTDEDQAIRKAEHVSESKMTRVDAENYLELENIFKKYGWPAMSLFGKKAASEYWLLVQHQDSHLEFQQRVLKAM